MNIELIHIYMFLKVKLYRNVRYSYEKYQMTFGGKKVGLI